MSIDWTSLWTWVKANKLISLVVVLFFALILLGGVLYLANWISTAWNLSRVEKAQREVNRLQEEAVNINAAIGNLRIQEAEKLAAVNSAKANLAEVRKEVDEEQKIANEALLNLNAVNDRDLNGTSPDNANAARCRAFPDSPECSR